MIRDGVRTPFGFRVIITIPVMIRARIRIPVRVRSRVILLGFGAVLGFRLRSKLALRLSLRFGSLLGFCLEFGFF